VNTGNASGIIPRSSNTSNSKSDDGTGSASAFGNHGNGVAATRRGVDRRLSDGLAIRRAAGTLAAPGSTLWRRRRLKRVAGRELAERRRLLPSGSTLQLTGNTVAGQKCCVADWILAAAKRPTVQQWTKIWRPEVHCSRPELQRSRHPEVLYGVDEESAVRTTVGRGLKLDAGLVEKYPLEVLESVSFRFLSRAPDFVAVSPDGQLEIVGRADRESICSPEVPGTGSRDSGDRLCQVRLDVAVQPMKYFDIIKARI